MVEIVQQSRLGEQKRQSYSRVWRIVPLGEKAPPGECGLSRVQYQLFINRVHEQGLRGHHRIGLVGIVYDYPYIHGCFMILDEANHKITLEADSEYALQSMAGSLHLPSRSLSAGD
jgi:hypothetical protein